jgi:hypothetical protein
MYDMGCEGCIMKWRTNNTQPSKRGITKDEVVYDYKNWQSEPKIGCCKWNQG